MKTMCSTVNPAISIILLTKNGGDLFKKCLQSIFSQDINLPYEVIMVDSGSTDDTLASVNQYPIQLYKIAPESFSFGPTRDYAFSQAKGQYLVTLSQDVVPANRDWLAKIVAPLVTDTADVVQGLTVIPDQGDDYGRDIFFWEKKGLFYFTSEGQNFIKKYGNIPLSCCSLAIKQQVWAETGFGDVLMNEDKAIQKKLIEKNRRIVFAYDSIAFHGHDYTVKSLISRCENEGLGWKCIGVSYPFSHMLSDLIQEKKIYNLFLENLRNKEIKSLAEFLFLIIRPIYIYKGNRFGRYYNKH
ncbi:MAG: glycosyltransferase family 2 protein [Candidatus Competibacteraceae bacterium]|nr:MAG: glycosyltransferase family 2 protein [Candidatus Competibacteraceae bacterium]